MTDSRLYPEITSDEQRRQYKKEFDSDLARYKSLCAEMDDISDQMHKLSRELDTLDEGSMKYQVGGKKQEGGAPSGKIQGRLPEYTVIAVPFNYI